MKVYICDDSKSDLLRLQRYIQKYAQEENLQIETEEFTTAKEMLLAHNAAKEKPVLLFLDIYMSQIDGMQAAKKLRKAGIKTSILFTTSSGEHAMEAFMVHADGYLQKPYDYEMFCHAMSKVSGQFQREYKTIDVRVDRMNRKIRVRDICFAETGNHGIQIYCMEDVYRTNLSMEGFKEQIGDEPSFVSCGRSYFINLAYVEEIDAETIYLKNKEMIPIPVRIRKQIKEQYQEYLQSK